jgi:hypothetical protein
MMTVPRMKKMIQSFHQRPQNKVPASSVSLPFITQNNDDRTKNEKKDADIHRSHTLRSRAEG